MLQGEVLRVKSLSSKNAHRASPIISQEISTLNAEILLNSKELSILVTHGFASDPVLSSAELPEVLSCLPPITHCFTKGATSLYNSSFILPI